MSSNIMEAASRITIAAIESGAIVKLPRQHNDSVGRPPESKPKQATQAIVDFYEDIYKKIVELENYKQNISGQASLEDIAEEKEEYQPPPAS